MSISERRHHIERLKKKRKNYWGFNMWRGHANERQLGILINTPKPCSCYMCRNRRKEEGETLQEIRHRE